MLFIKSEKILAGTAISPSSSTLAPSQKLIPISKLVEDSFKRPFSVFKTMFCKIGKAVFRETIFSTTPKPSFKFF